MNYTYYYVAILLLIIVIIFIIKFIKYPDKDLYKSIKNIKYTGDFKIPKKIHQIWIQGYDNINNSAKNVIKENLKMNPEWEYKFYDLEAIDKYIKEHESNYVYNAFKKINPKFGAVISDFFRYIVMYHEGGIYLDIKSKITKPLDEWVHQNKLLISFFGNLEEYNQIIISKYYKNCDINFKSQVSQFAFIYPKNFPVLRQLIDYISNNIYKYKDYLFLKLLLDYKTYNIYKIFTLSGPWLYSKFLGPFICNNKDKIIIFNHDGIKSIYDGNILYDGTNGEYYKQQNKQKTNYKEQTEKIIL
jgi:hypothetical protein